MIPRLYIAIAALVLAAGAVIWLRHDAVTDDRNTRAAETAKADARAHERMNHAPVSTGNPDDDLDWLREFGRAPAGPR